MIYSWFHNPACLQEFQLIYLKQIQIWLRMFHDFKNKKKKTHILEKM